MQQNGFSIGNVVDMLFANTKEEAQQTLQRAKARRPKVPVRDLELALTVLLVELASCDERFEPAEYQALAAGLHKVFGTPRSEIQALVNRANGMLANFSGTNRFAQLLKDNLDDATRKSVLEAINDVIGADGTEEGFEIYLRQRFAQILGVPLKAKEAAPAKQENQ